MLDVVRRTAEVVFMPLCVGGGIRTLDDIRELLLAGSDKVSINSAAPQIPSSCGRPPGGSAASASWSISTPNGCRKTAESSGKCIPTAAGKARGSKPWPGPGRSSGWGPAKSC